MSDKSDICYKCGNPATSREHVPPLCLFPEQKDCDGLDYRKGLITVPSCDEHNSKKSQDDEFLMMILGSVLGNNATAFIHLHTKVSRALQRKGHEYFKKGLMRNTKEYVYTTPSGVIYPLLMGEVNLERLNRCCEHIACGLYYYEFKKVFEGEVRLILSPMIHDDPSQREFVGLLKVLAEKEGANDISKIKGANPDIFKYVFLPPDRYGFFSLKMTFYQGTEIFVSFQPKVMEKPFGFVSSLIRAGIDITIKEGGQEFHFNNKKIDNKG